MIMTTFHNRRNHLRSSENDQSMMSSASIGPDDDDKSSLEAAAEAAAKVNAMLIAKGMLKPNQLHSGIHNVVTKKVGGPNSLVVAEVEINYLPPPCRNSLTRGTTQEEISKASGASVTTRGRYMTEDERIRNPRDRCLYLNIQAPKKESVDVAVQKIDEIIKLMGAEKMGKKGGGGPGFHGGGRFHSPPHPCFSNPRFEGKNQNIPQPALMSLPSPQQLQHPPPQLPQMIPQPQIHIPPPPPATVQVTVMQEKLYVGLEHAPPNFDTKNKLLGPVGSFLQHIQSETGTSVSLRGKGSGFMDLSGADAFEPMHIHIEHSSLIQLQEAKKLAENLIQTVQQSYVNFQQALAALPPSMPTGLITGVPQQPPMVEHHQLTVAQSGLATIPTVHEQSFQALQPQAVANTAAGQAMVLQPTSMTLQVPMVTPLPLSGAPPTIIQQSAPLDLVGQQPMIINHHQGPPPQAIVQQVVPAPGQPQPVPPPPGSGAAMAPAYAPVQQTVQLVSQAPPSMMQQPAPAIIAQPPPPQVFAHQPIQSMSVSVAPPSSMVYTVASSSGPPAYYSTLKDGEESKRRFREEKDDKIPENLLGYQHGPPHLVNLVRSSPPPQPQPVPPPPMSQGVGTHIIQQPPPGVVMSHIPPPGMEHLGGQPTFLQPAQQQPQQQHHQAQGPPPPHQFVSAVPPPGHQFVSAAPPPHHHLPPPMSSPSRFSPSLVITSSPNGEVRPQSHNDKSLMPPPPPPSSLGSPTDDGNKEESNKFEDSKETTGKRKSNGYNSEPEKKKIKGILKNKQDQAKLEMEEERSRLEQSGEANDEDQEGGSKNLLSPQYQGQPLRYPSMPSDPNVPPQFQEMGIHGQRPPHPGLPPNIITSHHHPHHMVQPSDPNLPPHVQHQPPQHIHIEGPRPEGPPQIMIEHPLPPGTPIHITHHPPGPPTSIPLEQHTRQLLIEHPHPAPSPLEQHMQPQPALQHESLPPPHPQHISIQTQQPPPHQEVLEYEVHPNRPPPPFQTFEQIPVSALSQPEPQTIIQQGPAVIAISSAQHFIPAMSSQTTPHPSSASFAAASQASGPIAIYSQPIHHHQQQQQQPQQPPQMLTAPPPPVPQPSFSIGVPPTSTQHFQAQFSHHPPQQVQGQVMPPPPSPALPIASQPQFHQPQPQGIHYWAS